MGDGGRVRGGGGQGGSEQRIEVFLKIQKKNRRGIGSGVSVWGGGGVRVDVNEEDFVKIQQQKSGGGVQGGRGGSEQRSFCENSKEKSWGGIRFGGGSRWM